MILKKFMNRTSLRFRITLVYAILHLITVIIIATGIGIVSNKLLAKESRSNLNQNITLATERLDALLDKLENASLHFTVTEAYKETYETNDDWNSYEDFVLTSSITSHLLEFLSVQKDVYSMAFFSYNGKSFYRAFDEDYSLNSSQNQEELLKKFLADDQTSKWYITSTKSNESVAELVFFRRMYNLNGTLRGILSLTLSNNSLHQLVSAELAQNASYALTFAEKGLDPMQLAPSVYVQGGDHSLLTVEREYPRLSCTITTQVPRASVYRNSYILVASILFIGISSLLLSLCLMFFSTRYFLSPLDKIVKTVHLLSQGDYTARVSSSLTDELGTLSGQIDKMAENTQFLMKKIEDTSEKKAEYEVAYLQMQMRPHFLYNTLGTLCGMITIHENDNAIALIDNISSFYRAVLSKGNSIITLKKELEISEYYIRIMNMRYHNQFSYKVNVQEEIMDCTLPKLTLQPLLENAIIHGFGTTKSLGVIEITGQKTDGQISLCVSDNGIGMTKEKLALLSGKSATAANIPFGLRSIEERLRLYMGESCRMVINSQWNVGTRICLSFPDIRTKKEDTHVLPISDR